MPASPADPRSFSWTHVLRWNPSTVSDPKFGSTVGNATTWPMSRGVPKRPQTSTPHRSRPRVEELRARADRIHGHGRAERKRAPYPRLQSLLTVPPLYAAMEAMLTIRPQPLSASMERPLANPASRWLLPRPRSVSLSVSRSRAPTAP